MKILFVTNYFPPHYIGGYELHCGRLAKWLCERGHAVRVVTSDFSLDPEAGEFRAAGLEVFRELELRYWRDVSDWGYWRREWRDVRCFRGRLEEFKPDVVVLWNMAKLASGLVMEAERRAGVLVYHLMDEWAANFRSGNGLPQFWSRPARSWWGRAAKPLVRGLYRALFTADVSAWSPENAVLVSKALGELTEKNGVEFENSLVSYITYDPDVFDVPCDGEELNADANVKTEGVREGAADEVRFLWAGRMCEGKGLFTTLDGLDLLREACPDGWGVDFCGPMEDEVNEGVFEPRLESAQWGERVRYLGSLSYEEMPRTYRAHDVFLFTSEVHEGLPGTIIEAFACGMPVIGTLTGGTKDVLRPEENCLVFEMGDAAGLAEAMGRLIRDKTLRTRLAERGARFAREQCGNDAVFPRLVEFYERLLERKGKSGGPRDESTHS